MATPAEIQNLLSKANSIDKLYEDVRSLEVKLTALSKELDLKCQDLAKFTSSIGISSLPDVRKFAQLLVEIQNVKAEPSSKVPDINASSDDFLNEFSQRE